MAQTVTLSFRVTADLAKALDELSHATERPKSWLLEQALSDYLEVQVWQLAHVQQGLDELKQGEGVPHGRVVEWVRSWDGDSELDPPR